MITVSPQSSWAEFSNSSFNHISNSYSNRPIHKIFVALLLLFLLLNIIKQKQNIILHTMSAMQKLGDGRRRNVTPYTPLCSQSWNTIYVTYLTKICLEVQECLLLTCENLLVDFAFVHWLLY